MRVAPILTYYNPGAANTKWRNITDAGDSGASASLAIGDSYFTAENPQVATDGVGELIAIHWSATAEF
jgi:hypothetical protein